ncbi:phosphatidylserine decarboxylase proenzyme 1, mitochondrial [Impatiens glandulifera]|uniref:phosphatidylserine decarboxylase proenzyme 1, mitochondrial n=1 Tax=Impatiens glandulifera TaxID=253017 RepID=UPI001FB14F8A|nr:phosphatidylserine decarboxylase proenzyme 1, mitochondrial [Impatiens glandulifera]
MKFRASQGLVPLLAFKRTNFTHHHHQLQRLCFSSLLNKAKVFQPRASSNGGSRGSSSSKDNYFLVPGATVATIIMLGALHARRLYDDKKLEEAREKGIQIEFRPDVKATFFRFLPLRSISRAWGFLSGIELPIWSRPYVYKAWARAFHSNLDEAALPLDEYKSLRDFFVRSLKEGSRPMDGDPCCLVSPVDGTILRFGELKEAGSMIEQVKGFSYSVHSLLGSNPSFNMIAEDMSEETTSQGSIQKEENRKSWWRIGFASPKIKDPRLECPPRGVFYCVIYLRPGDYHRIHSPVDWNIHLRRHFPGNLFPVNERATRTIRNLYTENERVVLEGKWQEGFMAMAAVGATNIGSIELYIEPTLQTNQPRKKLLHREPPEERVYEPAGIRLRKGEEVAAFNMGSTVVLVFQAPISKSLDMDEKDSLSAFKFTVNKGNRIRAGEALGRWQN